MTLRVLLIFGCFLILFTAFSQKNPVKISTLSSGIGSSSYLQSIGQSSVVLGTQSVGTRVIRQGFVQPSARSLRRSVEPGTLVSVEAFPNPFVSELRLKLSRSSSSVSQVELISIDGLRVWSGEIAPNLSEIQLLDFDRLPVGKYILRLASNKQIITKSLVKQ
jgi:hypothetical protein